MFRTLGLVLATLAFLVAAGGAFAHFKLNQNVRIFHIVHTDEGLDLYLRTPMAYLVAGLVGPENAGGLPSPAPYTRNRLENGTPMHLVDADALRSDAGGLGQLAADTIRIATESGLLEAQVIALRAYPIGQEPGFATRSEAEAALTPGPAFPTAARETYVGDTVVDIHLRLTSVGPVKSYLLSMSSDPGLPGQEDTANLILDYSGEETRTYRANGLLDASVEVSGSAIVAAWTFVIEGIRHILEGLDHVLFVFCMIIGAATLGGLIGRVTGFTIGHTVTLILGFFGFAPQGAWFIPAVETAIALSIILVAVDAVLRAGSHGEARDRYGIPITAALGLLHGFGFSFMLHNILQIDAPNVWQSLLAFNVGVEIGQLLIVAAVWPIVLMLRKRPAPTWRIASGSVAAVASIVACVWVFERVGLLLG
ncbi:MAG: HupE/UreJ family protein [Rhodobacteraceae bacterium]|nr:HupE/UreJ family protein [Paracoccaceae bacterium]